MQSVNCFPRSHCAREFRTVTIYFSETRYIVFDLFQRWRYKYIWTHRNDGETTRENGIFTSARPSRNKLKICCILSGKLYGILWLRVRKTVRPSCVEKKFQVNIILGDKMLSNEESIFYNTNGIMYYSYIGVQKNQRIFERKKP